MASPGFDWDDRNLEHIARHGVLPDEAEEVFRGRRFTQRSRGGTYATYGRKKRSGRIRVITARDMDMKERRRMRKEAGR